MTPHTICTRTHSVALDNELILFFGIFARVFLNVILWSMNLVHQATDQNNHDDKLERSLSPWKCKQTGQMCSQWSILFYFTFFIIYMNGALMLHVFFVCSYYIGLLAFFGMRCIGSPHMAMSLAHYVYL